MYSVVAKYLGLTFYLTIIKTIYATFHSKASFTNLIDFGSIVYVRSNIVLKQKQRAPSETKKHLQQRQTL